MYGIFALATFGVAAIFGMSPALAQETPAVTAPSEVAGREGLSLTVTGVAGVISVTLNDASQAEAVWTFADAGSVLVPRVLHLDLAAPAVGVEPVNGVAALAVAAGAIDLHRSDVVLDRDPVAPAVSAAVEGQDVELSWTEVSGPGGVTFSLERADARGSWSTLPTASPATSFSDRALAAGSYTYRLSAAVPGADGQPNQSQAAEVSVTVQELGPVPPAEPDSEPEGPADPPDGQRPHSATDGGAQAPEKSGAETAREVHRRRVAITGGNVRGIAGRSPSRPVVRGYSRGPNLAGLATRTAVLHRFALPQVASAMLREIAQPPAAARPSTAAPRPVPASTPLTVATTEPAEGPVGVAMTMLIIMLVWSHAVVWRGRVNPGAAGRP